MKKIIGLDHGNGWVKAMSNDYSIVFPSAIAFESELGEVTAGKSNLDLKTYSSALSGHERYLWGEDVIKLDGAMATFGSGSTRYNSEQYKLLCQFAIAELLSVDKKKYDELYIVTGMPSEEKGSSLETQFKEFLMDGASVKVNGKTVNYDPADVVVLAQPIGTLMSLYLDEQGFVKDDFYEDANVAIVDIGSGTTDIEIIQGLRRKSDSIISENIGMSNVYDRVKSYIKKQNPGVSITRQDVESQFSKDSFKLSARTSVDVSTVKRQALTEVATKITNILTQNWKNTSQLDRIIVTGGGGLAIGELIKEELNEEIVVADDSQLANSVGFFNYGYMKFADKEVSR